MASLVFWQGRWSSQHKGDVINRLHHLDRCDIVHYFHFQKSLLFSFEIQLLTIYYSMLWTSFCCVIFTTQVIIFKILFDVFGYLYKPPKCRKLIDPAVIALKVFIFFSFWFLSFSLFVLGTTKCHVN
jgi:hypothetical protein